MLSDDGTIMVVAEAASWSEALASSARANPDILLIVVPHRCSIFERLGELRGVAPAARSIVLSDDPQGADLAAAARARVWGCLPHDVTSGELRRAIHTVAGGRVAVGGSMSREEFTRLASARRETGALPLLSPAETRVMQVMSEGQTDGQIAANLGLSVPTVKTHVRAILRKTSTRNRTAAIAAAFRSGMLT